MHIIPQNIQAVQRLTADLFGETEQATKVSKFTSGTGEPDKKQFEKNRSFFMAIDFT